MSATRQDDEEEYDSTQTTTITPRFEPNKMTRRSMTRRRRRDNTLVQYEVEHGAEPPGSALFSSFLFFYNYLLCT
jgi:hypothetical protein